MLLYHISTRKPSHEPKQFVPWIPMSANEEYENTTIPRICFANSIAHALQATGYSLLKGESITIYVLDTETIDQDAIVSPKQLHYMHLVPDSIENQEYWVLVPVRLKGYEATIEDVEYQQTKHPRGQFTYVTKLTLDQLRQQT